VTFPCDASPIVGEEYQDEQEAVGRGRHHEEIGRADLSESTEVNPLHFCMFVTVCNPRKADELLPAVQLAALFFSVQLLLSSYANTTESSLHRRAKYLRDRRIAQGTSRTE
jgi:hypothetical protein